MTTFTMQDAARLGLAPLLIAALLSTMACSKSNDTSNNSSSAGANEGGQEGAASIAEGAAIPVPEPAAPSLTSVAAPPAAKVFFVDLKEGAKVASPLTVKFGIDGIGIAPAGDPQPNTGHHHLIVDAELPPPDAPIPANDNYLHFGKGQTEATITLTPGAHTLQLALGNYLHVPFNPPVVSEKITITVQ